MAVSDNGSDGDAAATAENGRQWMGSEAVCPTTLASHRPSDRISHQQVQQQQHPKCTAARRCGADDGDGDSDDDDGSSGHGGGNDGDCSGSCFIVVVKVVVVVAVMECRQWAQKDGGRRRGPGTIKGKTKKKCAGKNKHSS